MFRCRFLAICMIAALPVMILTPFAFAQATAPAPVTYTISLKPVIDAIVALLAAVLTGLGSWAVTRLSTWLKLQNDDQVRSVITAGVNTAIGYAITRIQASAGELSTVKTQNAVVAEGTQFIAAHFPDAIKYFGLSTDDLARMILARLPPPTDPIPGAAAAPAAANIAS